MRYRDPKKESDLFSMIEHQQAVLKAVKGINKLNAVIDWELFREELESVLGYDNRDPRRGGAASQKLLKSEVVFCSSADRLREQKQQQETTKDDR